MNLRQMTAHDIHAVTEVHKAAFTRQTMSREWIQCNLNACSWTPKDAHRRSAAILLFRC